MEERPAIPLLVLFPGETSMDLDAIYAIAQAYAKAGLLISDYGHHRDAPVFAFPAVVCAGFAIELYFKFFLMLSHVESGEVNGKKIKEHKLPNLWQELRSEDRALIAGMYRNKSGKPLSNAMEIREELFLKAVDEIGDSPFVRWRYAHELTDVGHMSHAAIQEVLDALERAAEYMMQERRGSEGLNECVSLGVGKSLLDGLAGIPSQQDWKSDPLGVAAKELKRGKPLLLGRESPLRRIPSNLAPRTAFHLDELRQAAESIDVAYSRLHQELTSLALQAPAPEEIHEISAHLFFDAWGIVGAINRFYQAYVSFPGIVFNEPTPGHQTLDSVTKSVRLLHQLSYDLELRKSKILPARLPSLGEITWMTGVRAIPPTVAWHCTLRPGWMATVPVEQKQNEPLIGTLHWPTDSIILAFAETKADLSLIRMHIAARLWHLEGQIFREFNAPNFKDFTIINDFFSRRPVSPVEPD